MRDHGSLLDADGRVVGDARRSSRVGIDAGVRIGKRTQVGGMSGIERSARIGAADVVIGIRARSAPGGDGQGDSPACSAAVIAS